MSIKAPKLAPDYTQRVIKETELEEELERIGIPKRQFF